jgi:hypothetical protein
MKQRDIMLANRRKARDKALQQWSADLYNRAGGERGFYLHQLFLPREYTPPKPRLMTYDEWLWKQGLKG